MAREEYIKCEGCGEIKPKHEMFRVYTNIFRIGSKKPEKHISFGYYCSQCVNKLRLVVSD